MVWFVVFSSLPCGRATRPSQHFFVKPWDGCGNQNFVGNFVWQSKDTPGNNSSGVAETHNHILAYRRAEDFAPNLLARNEKQIATYSNPDNDERGPWLAAPLTRVEHRDRDYYSIKNKAGRDVLPPKGSSWRRPPAKMKELEADDRIWWGKDDDSDFPMEKKFLSEAKEGVVNQTWWPYDFAGSTRNASAELKELFDGEKLFDTPKPVELLQRILQLATNPGDLILDSFAGSGTTGHAVLKLNAAGAAASAHEPPESPPGFGLRQSSGAFPPSGQPTAPEQRQKTAALQNAVAPNQPPRSFILVEMEPKIARDITGERVRRVAQGYTNAKGEQVAGLGGGFRFCELGEPLFDERGKIRSTVRFADLARHVYFTETGEPLPRERVGKSPLLGVTASGVAVYLLFNGILQDRSVDGGNVLTGTTFAVLPPHAGPKVVYAAGCRFSRERLKRENIVFKQTPYAIRV